MPAEFAPHEGCLMIWPERGDSWQYGAYAARKAFLRVIETISESESMTVLCSEGQYDNARAQLPDRVRLVVMATDDAWARDVGPTFVVNSRGERRGIDWGFNAWGGNVDGLYPSWENDNRVARKFCDLLGDDVYDKRDFICEGGSIHTDGEGTALVTEACLLSAGRNPDLTKAEIERVLCDYLGVSKVIWLPRGIYNDETNEHVDNVCAFTAPGEVVLAWTDDEDDPQYALSAASLAVLETELDAKGRRIKVHKLPLPKPVTITAEECEGLDLCEGEPTRAPGERLAASYVNFYIANHAVVMPAFGDPADERAQEILRKLFPTREIVAIPARDILIGGGNIHCITQQIPKKYGADNMSKVTVAAVQMTYGLENAMEKVREAASQGAQIILLPELFENWYFCQEKSYENYHLATTLEENPAVRELRKIAHDFRVVLPVSYYERVGNTTFNTVAVIDADGSILGQYRKTHIPDDHFYQEKFYFTPGDTGFKVWDTAYAKIGVGICWDQWFPESARCMALMGAEILFYPTAIGSEPILDCDSMPHWRRCMQGHAAANIMPLIAANRIGTETVQPSEDNQQQSSSLTFYGSSFIADETGALVEQADRENEGVLTHTFDLDAIREMRHSWGVFRDRRPEMYGALKSFGR